MDQFGLGATVCVDFTVKDKDGNPTDPTSQTFTVRRPDCSTYTVTPSHTGVGAYTAEIEQVDEAGQWWWDVTTVDPDDQQDGTFLVRASMVA